MKNVIKSGCVILVIMMFTSCYDREIIDSKALGFSIPDVENLNYSRKGKIVTFTWELPANISEDFKKPVEVSFQMIENGVYKNITRVDGDLTSVDITVNTNNKYKFIVKLIGYLTDEAQTFGNTDRYYSKGKIIDLVFDPADDIDNKFQLKRPIFIDFGGVDISGPPYNVFASGQPGTTVTDLKDDAGANTNFSIMIEPNEFDGFFWDGWAFSNPNIFGFHWKAGNDCFDMNGDWKPYVDFVIFNLNLTDSYDFYFYGSCPDNGSVTNYKVMGKTEGEDTIVTFNNPDQIAFVQNIAATEDGEIRVRLSAGAGNTHIYLKYNINVMIIIPAGYDMQFPVNHQD